MAEPTHEDLVQEAARMFAEDQFVRDLVILFDAEFDSVEVSDDRVPVRVHGSDINRLPDEVGLLAV